MITEAQRALYGHFEAEVRRIRDIGPGLLIASGTDKLTDTACTGRVTLAQDDGSQHIYTVTLTVKPDSQFSGCAGLDTHVTCEEDHLDDHWGPGGYLDGHDGRHVAVINHTYYEIGDGYGFAGRLGFGGRKFVIEFFDGRRITTNDLWCAGTVPPKWRRRHPDNACFIQEETP